MKPWTLFSIACWFLSIFAVAMEAPPPMIDPKTYRSPSGRFSLEVDPTDLYGRGESKCRLLDEGREVWAKTLPFTFANALITEEGLVAGYGYTEGIRGWAKGGFAKGSGDLCVVILDAAGVFRLDERRPRMRSRTLHGSPVPTAREPLLNPGQDRFALHIFEEQDAYWQAYELSTGKRGAKFEIKPEGAEAANARYMIKAQAVAGTPLTLTHWWSYDQRTGQTGALFTLVDLAGRQVWELSRPADYMFRGDEEAVDRQRMEIQDKGAILDTEQAGMFDLWFVSDKLRAIHKVERNADGWRVTEIGRRPYSNDPKHGAAPPPVKPLPVLGTFTLSDQPVASALGNVQAWAFDGRGQIGVLREGAKGTVFVLLNQAGKVLAQVPLPDCGGSMQLDWLQADRWVAAGSEPDGKKARAWWLDAKKKTKREIVGFSSPEISSLASTRDGGFAVLATERGNSTLTDFIIAFDAEGRRRWTKTEREDDGPAEIFSPEAIAVTTRGELAVLDVIRHTVQLFDLKGALQRTVELEKSWGRKPNYPSEIVADHDGGFVVYDFDAPKPFVWMKADGAVREEFHPKYADGRDSDPHWGLRIAPDGQAWSCDGPSIFHLNEQRLAAETLGVAANPTALQNIWSAGADAAGNLYAVDGRTGTVHVFASDGRKVRTMKPEKGDFGRELSPELVVSPEGVVYLGGLGREGFVQFAPDGSRVGRKGKLRLDNVSEEWFPRGGERGLVVAGYEAAFLVNKSGDVTRKIERRADRKWLGHPDDAAVAGDGSFALTSSSEVERNIDFYTVEGEPIATGLLPERWSNLRGYNGQHAVVQTEKEIWLYNRKAAPVLHFAPPKAKGEWQCFVTREGRELWVLDQDARKVTRYAMPAVDAEK